MISWNPQFLYKLTQVLSIIIHFYVECPSNCDDCTNFTTCQSCTNGYFLQNTDCLKCNSTCLTCSGPDDYSCLTCSTSYMFQKIEKGHICTLACNTGYYSDICNNEHCCKEICGDGVVYELPCDDGNRVDGDGCSTLCTLEPDFICTQIKGRSVCKSIIPVTAKFVSPIKIPVA